MPKASDIMTEAAKVLQDQTHVRWTLPELRDWINHGQRAIVLAKPSAKSQSVVLTLVAGTLQSLTDASHLLLLRITRNITSEGPPRVGGRAIRSTTREQLDTVAPNWHVQAETPYKAEVRQFIYDEENPREFYVYPGNDATGKVEALVAVMPTLVAASGDENLIGSYTADIALPEPYGVPLLDYVLFRAFSKDDIVGNAGRASSHYRLFADALGVKINVEGTSSPNSRARVTSA